MRTIKSTEILVLHYALPVAITLVIILGACHTRPQVTTSAEGMAVAHFQETGHPVSSDFLDFFNRYGGIASFGYPLTAEIVVDGWRMQYFEKGRLEYHPENEPAYRVTAGWLGELLHRYRPPVSPENIPAGDDQGHRYYPQTGHTLSGDFLDYFDSHGGSVRFGLPISEPFLWEGHLTQDFQSARFFWTPQAKEPVRLEEIGRVYLETISQRD